MDETTLKLPNVQKANYNERYVGISKVIRNRKTK